MKFYLNKGDLECCSKKLLDFPPNDWIYLKFSVFNVTFASGYHNYKWGLIIYVLDIIDFLRNFYASKIHIFNLPATFPFLGWVAQYKLRIFKLAVISECN